MYAALSRLQKVRFALRAATLLPLLFELLLVQPACAQEPALTPESKRMTDDSQYHDNTVYQVLEERLKNLNASGNRISDYDMAKAQCWIDVSFHEYSRNDRTPFPDQAIGEAEHIIEALENKQTPSHDTPLINEATRLRPDLWQRLDTIKASPALECAAQAVACAEVELVHAGSEYRQFGWRHANPYVEIAEDLAADANASVQQCEPPPPPPPPPPRAAETAPLSPASVAPLAHTNLQADTLFAFKSAELTRHGRAVLDQLVKRIPEGEAVDGVAVVGYADRIDVYHDPKRNLQLSTQRAATVAAYLGSHGLDAHKIRTYGRGASDPVVNCEDQDKAKLYACLAPNRRVEITVTGVAVPGK